MLFLFRRDLRTVDNRGLAECHREAKLLKCKILPVFVLSNAQCSPERNAYFSPRAFELMRDCLADLKRSVPHLAVVRSDDDVRVLRGIHDSLEGGLRGVFFNADVTPYARERDARIETWCRRTGVPFRGCTSEYSLVDPTAMEKPYQVFTPFYRRYLDLVDARAASTVPRSAFAGLPFEDDFLSHAPAKRRPRAEGLRTLARIRTGAFDAYEGRRDVPADRGGTTRLSALLKFGAVSVREAFRAVEETHGRSHGLARELLWRAFYDQVAFHFPRVLAGQLVGRTTTSSRRGKSKSIGNSSLRERYDAVPWATGQLADERFRRWATGTTGVPLVDAGMRQLVGTGYMHNRLRMITASFLIKSLHVDWRRGERFFAEHLEDYHPTANSGGWQWASGGGADSQQFNRTFSPWLQAAKFDPRCEYIKEHVPELRGVPPEAILAWASRHQDLAESTGYPPPVVDHSAEVRRSNEAYKGALYGIRTGGNDQGDVVAVSSSSRRRKSIVPLHRRREEDAAPNDREEGAARRVELPAHAIGHRASEV